MAATAATTNLGTASSHRCARTRDMCTTVPVLTTRPVARFSRGSGASARREARRPSSSSAAVCLCAMQNHSTTTAEAFLTREKKPVGWSRSSSGLAHRSTSSTTAAQTAPADAQMRHQRSPRRTGGHALAVPPHVESSAVNRMAAQRSVTKRYTARRTHLRRGLSRRPTT